MDGWEGGIDGVWWVVGQILITDDNFPIPPSFPIDVLYGWQHTGDVVGADRHTHRHTCKQAGR